MSFDLRGEAAEQVRRYCITMSSKQAKLASTRSSEEEHMENALALGAEEGRDKLR